MSKLQILRELVNQRLTAAFEDIQGLFDRTISEYEEEFHRSQQEKQREVKRLKAAFNPEVRLHRAGLFTFCVLSRRSNTFSMQERRSSLDQEEPESSHIIKEKQDEVLISQEGEQLHHLEEADITKFTFTLVPVKSEEDEEKVQSSQLQKQSEEKRE
ncbi:hypothetical protein LDENG_00220610, partial [Lucifuga dentata]